MFGFVKTVAVVLMAGAIFLGQPQSAASEKDTGDAELSGDVPRYYLELLQFSSAHSEDEEDPKPALFEYRIEPGDSLYSIAHRFGTDIKTLVRLNNIVNPHYIVIGDVIEILTVVGAVHDAEEGDTVADIAKLYEVGEEIIAAANDLNSKDILTRGVRVIVPGAALSRGGYYPSLIWPLHGVLTSGYGWRNGKFHYAIDIGAPYGTPFYAAAAGRVIHAGYLGAYGIMVELDHGNGFLTRYAHASKVAVAQGQQVASGQVIGYVGMTGNTTGPHLHFELLDQGARVNPLEYLD
jgi:murein DD-endopeptidase MepM/ murein hydrolase activator NlpD